MFNPTAKKQAMSDIAAHLGKSIPTFISITYGATFAEWYQFGISHMELDFSIDMNQGRNKLLFG